MKNVCIQIIQPGNLKQVKSNTATEQTTVFNSTLVHTCVLTEHYNGFDIRGKNKMNRVHVQEKWYLSLVSPRLQSTNQALICSFVQRSKALLLLIDS